MRVSLAAALGVALVTSAAPAAARVRVAISELQLEGNPPPALANQLQDGFVLGFVRGGVQVLDPTDTAKKLEGHPELQRCDTSPCLKAVGQLLDVGYIVRVRVEIAGNSYKTVGRMFTTEGAAPAVLPIATESKSCEVCTVAEARGVMLQLADALRGHIEEPVAAPPPVPPAPPPAPPRLLGPVVLAMVGALAVGAGIAVLESNGSCTESSCDQNRTKNMAGGILLGAGAAFALTGAYVTVIRSHGGDPVTGVAVALRW